LSYILGTSDALKNVKEPRLMTVGAPGPGSELDGRFILRKAASARLRRVLRSFSPTTDTCEVSVSATQAGLDRFLWMHLGCSSRRAASALSVVVG